MNIKNRFIRLFLIINKKLKLKSNKDKTESSIGSVEDVSSEEEYLNFTYDNISQMKTSTPMKKLPIKVIMIQEVSNLKIYEDFDDIDMINNNDDDDEDLNISELTVYENLRHLQNNNFDYDYIPFIEESSGFKIYEDIGESFVVE